MLTTLLYIYLSGWAGFSGYGIYTCQQESKMHGGLTTGECQVLAVVAGPAWPYFGYQYLTNESWD